MKSILTTLLLSVLAISIHAQEDSSMFDRTREACNETAEAQVRAEFQDKFEEEIDVWVENSFIVNSNRYLADVIVATSNGEYLVEVSSVALPGWTLERCSNFAGIGFGTSKLKKIESQN